MKEPHHLQTEKNRRGLLSERGRSAHVVERANLRQLIYAMEHYQSLDASASTLQGLKQLLTAIETHRPPTAFPG